MASIRDLQNNQDDGIIDATQPPKDDGRPSSKDNRGKTVVNLNGISEELKGRHTQVVSNQQKIKKQPESQPVEEEVLDMTAPSRDSGKRVAADLSSLPDMTPEEAAYAKEHFKENPLEDIIGDNSESILGKYLTNKEVELTEALEAEVYKEKLKELEEEAELTGDDSAVIDFLNGNNEEEDSNKTVIVNDDDILSKLDNKKDTKEEEVMSFEEETKDVEETVEEFNDNELDDQQLYPEDDYPTDEDEEEYEDTNDEVLNNLDDISADEEPDPEEIEESIDETMDKLKENRKKLEATIKIEKPDIDLEVTSVEAESNSIIDDIDVDLEVEEESVPEPEDDSQEILKKLQALATERLKPVSKKLDISSFTVVKKPVTSTKAFSEKPTKAAKWVLMNQGSSVFMREFTGAELERLREFSADANSVTNITKRYRIIYDHIDSPKPASFEAWLKSTPFADEDHYFFAIYIASFKGANYLPRDCSDQTNCKETWLTEDVDIMDMVNFESEEAKEKFTNLYREEDSSLTKAGLYVSEIVPLSNTVAVAFREPSIYTRIELSSLDNEFREKYQAIMEYIPYIDSLYYINQEEGTLTPVGYKAYADNNVKTTKSRIQQFAKVLSTLSVDEFGVIRPYVNSVATRSSGISYKYPECTCPKCGSVVDEVVTSAEELLFTRYQLGALVNTSLN